MQLNLIYSSGFDNCGFDQYRFVAFRGLLTIFVNIYFSVFQTEFETIVNFIRFLNENQQNQL